MSPVHLVAAPDKFRGTASAAEIAAAAARGAKRAGWTCARVPLADGGDGLLAAVGGEARYATVTGPLGEPVRAEWRLLADPERAGEQTAVIEMARASGLLLAGGRRHNRPVEATTFGTGELVLAALWAGASRIVVGCGGSAATDGGEGALAAIGAPSALDGVELLVASDVSIGFVDAAVLFAAQKGASTAQVAFLTARLVELADRYRADFGVEVAELAGSGAAGGLAGGLAALGAEIVSGFDLVADLVGLDQELERATLVMTGEGHLDQQSFAGKVVGGVVGRVRGRLPVICIVGGVAPGFATGASSPSGAELEIVSLSARFGQQRARREVAALVEDVVAERLHQEPSTVTATT